MKKAYFILVVLLLWGLVPGISQSNPDIQISVEVDPDTLLMDNVFYITYNIEGKVGEFLPPSFEYFTVLSQNQGSSLSIINGEASRTSTYTFALKPKEPGVYAIDPAVLQLPDGQTVETTPISIEVYPNPTGRQIATRRQKQMGIFGRDFFKDRGSIWDSFDRDFFGLGKGEKGRNRVKKAPRPRKKRYKL